MTKFFQGLIRDERGISALEYAILAGIIVAVIIGLVTAFGDDIGGVFNRTGDQLENVGTQTTPAQ